jgi:hypothetical protein
MGRKPSRTYRVNRLTSVWASVGGALPTKANATVLAAAADVAAASRKVRREIHAQVNERLGL